MLNRMNQGHIDRKLERFFSVVVVCDLQREERAVLENQGLRLREIVLRPWNSQTGPSVGIEVVSESNHIVLHFADSERVEQIRRMSLIIVSTSSF